jgi:hypothetical protein
LLLSNDCNLRFKHGFLIICLAGTCGLVGSLIDSILGKLLTKNRCHITENNDQFKNRENSR